MNRSLRVNTVYAGDTTFFLQNIESIFILVESLKQFSTFPGLKPNAINEKLLAQGQIGQIGRMWYEIHFIIYIILGRFFLYNETLRNQKNFFSLITDTQSVLNQREWKP